MGFPEKIKEEILVRSARHCCVCHKAKGLNIEIHHIRPSSQGGEDTLENAIALCYDCHSDAGHYFAGHPKGLKLSPKELQKHKKEWFKIVNGHKIKEPKNVFVELSIDNKDFQGKFAPTFIKETTIYLDRGIYKRMNELLGKDVTEFVNEFKNNLKTNITYLDYHLNKVETYDELMDYLNGDFFKVDNAKPNTNCQPILHQFGAFRIYKEINKSNCILNLKLTNCSFEVLEDYKLSLSFENVVEVDSVNKNTSVTDMHQYKYNVRFFDVNNGEFTPERNILVQNDSILLDAICFRPDFKAKFVNLNWVLFARGMHSSGSLKIEIKSKFERKTQQKFIDNPAKKKNVVRVLPKIEFD